MTTEDKAQTIVDILDIKKLPLKAYFSRKDGLYYCRMHQNINSYCVDNCKSYDLRQCNCCGRLLRSFVNIYNYNRWWYIFNQLKYYTKLDDKIYICIILAKSFINNIMLSEETSELINILYRYVFIEIIQNFPIGFII